MSPPGPLGPSNNMREAWETLFGIVAGLLAGVVGAFAAMACYGLKPALAAIAIAFAGCVVFAIQQARKRETTVFMRAFYIAASVVLLLCSACSGMMVFSNGRIAG